MTAKEYLNSYKEYQQIADMKKEKWLTAADDLVNLPSSSNYQDIKTGRNLHAQEDRIIRAQQKKEAWAIAELNALEVRQDIFSTIVRLPSIEFALLHERYLNLNQWDIVAEKIELALTQTHRTHRKALADLQEIIDNNCGNSVVISDSQNAQMQ